MTINDISANLLNSILLKGTSNNYEWEIQTGARFENNKMLPVFLTFENDEWLLTDKKETLKYMNEMYDLKSEDVKKCIVAVVKIYGFNIRAGALTCEIKDEKEIQKKLFDFIMCIGQLSNMYAFFDEP